MRRACPPPRCSAGGHVKAIPATRQPNPTRQHTRNGPGKPLKVYKVGIGGGFYAGQTEIRGIP